jgi:ATP-dependent exoDNAse (exonuclease V) beta subunit
MTVHKAKGLEFPIVVLADPTCNAIRGTPSRHVDPARRLWLEPLCGSAPVELLETADDELRRDHAEAIRTAYVAATRARDLLILPVCGDQPIEGWLEVLNPALYPLHNARQNSDLALGCPTFGEDSVLDRGPKGIPPASGPVRPGLHRPIADGPPVAWWDPSKLRLDVEEQAPLRHQHVLEVDLEGATAAASQKNYAVWDKERLALRAQSAQPSISVQTVTSLVRARKTATSLNGDALEGRSGDSGTPVHQEVQIEMVERDATGRPGGRRFGALVHAMLASVNLDAGVDTIRSSAIINGRIFGAAEDEIEAAIAAVGTALLHPIMRRAAASAERRELRRETPISLVLDDGRLVEGVVDLAFHELTPDFAGWTVVDFKTDREFTMASDEYIEQVRIYSRAIEIATKSPARGILLVL